MSWLTLMPRSLPPLGWFRAFESAARHLNFTAAAGELSLTQSAGSQHVRSLELRLGSRLFTRKARGLELTDAGRRLVPYVAGAIGELASATELFGVERPDDLLCVATRDSFAQAILAPGLPRFLESNPGVRIRFLSTLWPDNDFLSEADVEIRLGARGLVASGATRLFPDRVVPVCAPGLIRGRPSVARLYGLPLIQTVGSSDTWTTWARSVSAPVPPAVSQLVDSYGLAMELARRGGGVALVSRFLAAPAVHAGELHIPLRRSAPARDNFYLAVRSAQPGSPARRFEQWVRGEVAHCARRLPAC